MILNYRTLASGLENKDHQQVKTKLLTRSSYFTRRTVQLTAEYLSIFDLRSVEEVLLEPSIAIDNSEVIHYYVGGDFNQRQAKRANTDDPKVSLAYASEHVPEFYAELAFCPQLKAVVSDIVKNPRPALIHCTAGKDRTGLICVILMELLDFERSVIYAEYLTIDQDLVRHLENKFSQQYKIEIGPKYANLFTVDKSFLDSFYAVIFDKYESFENYVHNFLELSTLEISNFKEYYLD